MNKRNGKLNVIFEDNHLLVVDKPPLLATMGSKPGQDSLYLQAKSYIKQKYDKPGNVFIGVVSRLDAFVSGVVVLARTSKAASRLSQQFRDGSVQKTYWAIIPKGSPDQLMPRSGWLVDRVVKNEAQHRMVVLPKSSQPVSSEKEARLSYQTIGETSNQKFRLVEIELETGRKHQIRVQFSNANCAIIGDKKYGSNVPFERGIALHSRKLRIQHPTKKVLQSFESAVPACWKVERFQ